MARLSLALLLLLLAGPSLDLLTTTRPGPALAHAKTILVGGKKGWPGIKSWTQPFISGNDVLVFKWGSSSVSGPKHNVALATDEAAMLACNTKSVFVELVKPKRKGVYRVALQRSAHFFFSTVGKDCAAKGMKLQYSAA